MCIHSLHGNRYKDGLAAQESLPPHRQLLTTSPPLPPPSLRSILSSLAHFSSLLFLLDSHAFSTLRPEFFSLIICESLFVFFLDFFARLFVLLVRLACIRSEGAASSFARLCVVVVVLGSGHTDRKMRPKSYSANKALDGGKELSWMDQMCLKIETYCELGEPGRGPTLLMQEMEMQFNSLGSGLRKLANEANDFVQELLMPPTFLNDNGEATEKGVDLKKQCNVGIVHGQKKNVEQPTAAPLNFVDGACIEISAHAEVKEDSCHSGMLNLASVEEQSSLHSEGSFEVTWDWPQEPFELSQEAETEQQLLQDVGEASCSSVQLPEAALEASRSVKDESSTDAKDIQDPNEMVEGEEQLAIRLSKKEEPKKLRQPSMSSSSLDGWESSDVLICEEIIEPDSWHDWELL